MEPSARLLRYFVVVADSGSFTRAADQLHVSQPALSQQIRKLERELGFPLFRRGTRGIALTRHGGELLEAARAVVAVAEDFHHAARRLAGGPRQLTIGFRAQAANELTPQLIAAFKTHRPNVEVLLRQYPLAAVMAGLDDGDVDLALLRLPVILDGFDCLPLLIEPRVAVLPEGHPLAGREHITLADLDGLTWITTPAADPTWQHFARGGDHHTPAPTDVVVNTVDEYLEAVAAGRGIAMAPHSATRYYTRPGVCYVPVTDAAPSTVVLAWDPRTLSTNPTAAAFVTTARQQAR